LLQHLGHSPIIWQTEMSAMWWVSPEFEAEAAAMVWVKAAQEKVSMPTSGNADEEMTAREVCTPQKLNGPKAGKPCSLRALRAKKARLASKKGGSTTENAAADKDEEPASPEENAAKAAHFEDLEAATPEEVELLPNVCYSFMLWMIASKGRAEVTALHYGRTVKNLFKEHGRSFKTMCTELYADRIQEAGGKSRHSLLQTFSEFWTWHQEGPNPSWDQAPKDFFKDMQRVWREWMAEKAFKKHLAAAKKRAADRPLVEAEPAAKKPRLSENALRKMQEAKELAAQKRAAWLAASFAAGNRATPAQEEGTEGESSTTAATGATQEQTSAAASSEPEAPSKAETSSPPSSSPQKGESMRTETGATREKASAASASEPEAPSKTETSSPPSSSPQKGPSLQALFAKGARPLQQESNGTGETADKQSDA